MHDCTVNENVELYENLTGTIPQKMTKMEVHTELEFLLIITFILLLRYPKGWGQPRFSQALFSHQTI